MKNIKKRREGLMKMQEKYPHVTDRVTGERSIMLADEEGDVNLDNFIMEKVAPTIIDFIPIVVSLSLGKLSLLD